MPAQTASSPGRGSLPKTTPEDQGRVELPGLAPHLRVHEIGEGQMLLVSESFNTLLHGKVYCSLLPLLDGERTLDEIAAALDGAYPAADVLAAVASLAARGYVVSADHGMGPSRAAYWSTLGASPRWVEQRLTECRVAVVGDGEQLARHLEASGAKVATSDPDLTVIVCDDYLGDALAGMNRRQLERGTPWMPVRPRGMAPLFGPVFRSDGVGPCWACLAYRLRSHQEVHNFLRNFAGEEQAFKPFATDPVVLEAVHGLIAAEILKWLVLGETAPLHDKAISMDVGTLSTSEHRVMRRPQCPVCGDEALHRPDRAPLPLRLGASPKLHRNSGGARAVAPEATLAKYRHLVSPISGVVTWLSRTTDETDPWLHVYWAGSNLGMRSRTLSSLRRSLRSKSAGKGSTREQSEVSALCEAIERYSGALHGDEIRVRRRLADFGDAEAVHPNAAQLFSDSQLDNAQSINAKGHPYNVVPPRFAPDAEVDWTPVWSLTEKRHRYLPTSMLYSMAPEQRAASDLIADSNGCAAGNTLEEAIVQGFYELVERDAFAVWWYNRLRVAEVDLASFDDTYLAGATSHYATYGRDLWMLDVTSDIGIPTFVALSRRPDGDTEDIIYGAGCHADPRLAALRALCELNQCLTWLPRPGKPDGRPMIDDPLALWWWKVGRLKDCPWLAPAADQAPRTPSHYDAIESADARDDIEFCRTLVEARGMEFLVLDQTRPDIGMPVVRVIVPGMRHFWPRFAPGRLYDVPVDMGHRKHRLQEADLNPTPVIA